MNDHNDILGAAGTLGSKSLEEMVAFCRANGIRKLKYAGAEIEFAPNAGTSAATPEALQQFAQALAGATPSDAQMLGWSAPGDFPEDLQKFAEELGLVPAPAKE